MSAVLLDPVDEPGARLAFDLPPSLEAGEPPEASGRRRDSVRMLVARRSDGDLVHSSFRDLPDFLDPGDLVVVNTSATIPAAIDGFGPDGTPVVVHLSTEIGARRWVVELRRPAGLGTERWTDDPPSRTLAVAGNGAIRLIDRYRGSERLWVAEVSTSLPILTHLAILGRPIRYRYVTRPWGLDAYQNVYAVEPGSAEMPSAGRPFTAEVVTRLVANGVGVTPIVLHTGVASLEADEVPYPEWFRVPAETADRVNLARRSGHRVIAVGTTVVRALESAADASGRAQAADGWTELVMTPARGTRIVDGLLTGWHEPEASHLLMLEAIAGRPLLERSYAAATRAGYLWHEFGDVHLILP
ncbi:MAG: S-adenosylmethionine:tRNA ribosyltransferase-isomerase [Acidimicrobiales bacterium]